MPRMKDAPVNPDEVSRYTQRLTNRHQFKLAQLAKEHKISQLEEMEVMLDQHDLNAMGPLFKKIREDKLTARTHKKELVKQLAKLDVKELEKLVERDKQEASAG